MNYKYETSDQKKLRAFNAISALECRGRPSITLEMALDEIAFNIGEPSARTPDGRRACRGIGDALAQLVADGTLYTKNHGNSYHTTGPACKATSTEVMPATVQPIVMQERKAELLDSSLDALLNRDADMEVGTQSNHDAKSEMGIQSGHTATSDNKVLTDEVPTKVPTDTEVDKLADDTKKSNETGIGWDKAKCRWRFRRLIDGKRKTIGTAPDHAGIVAIKRQWESDQS